MADSVKRVEYFYAILDDKPGEGARLLSGLKERDVNLVAATGFPDGKGRVQLDLFPVHAEELRKAAEELRITLVGPKKAFLVQGSDRVGALADVHRKLADANINVVAANGASDGRGGYGYVLWVKPADYDQAAKALSA
jgi:hypothetical protein